MYTSYFGLKEKPFAIAPNPKYLFLSEAHREALAHLLYGINGEGCISLLTGDVGTGKTTVCRCLIEQAPENTDIAIILNPKLSILDLLSTICEEFGITVSKDDATVKTYTDAINTYLLETHSQGRNSALIIDEAQNLDIEILEHLRLLTNLETDTKKLLQIVLIGQPELRELLEDPSLLQVNQRITTRFHLGPLRPSDVEKYVQHRIEIAGGRSKSKLFEPSCLPYLVKVSKGVPRIINLLCDRALLGAYVENREKVSLDIFKKSVDELRSGPPPTSRFKWRTVLAIVALSLVIIIPTALYFTFANETNDWFKQFLVRQHIVQPADTEISEPKDSESSIITIRPLVKKASSNGTPKELETESIAKE